MNIMNERLNKFLEENIHLLEQGLFLDAFLLCPQSLRRDFIQTLKDGKIDITDTSLHYYGFKQKGGHVLIASKYDVKKDAYEVATINSSADDVRIRLIIMNDLAKALEFAVDTWTEPSIMMQSVIDSIQLVPIKLSDGTECLMSQEGVDYYNPDMQKDRRFKLAAKQELDTRFEEYTKSTFNFDRLKKALQEFEMNNNLYRVGIYVHPAEIIINLDYDSTNRDKIKDILVREINSPIDIVWDDPTLDGRILVKLKSKQFDKIKAEVEDLFGVRL